MTSFEIEMKMDEKKKFSQSSIWDYQIQCYNDFM